MKIGSRLRRGFLEYPQFPSPGVCFDFSITCVTVENRFIGVFDTHLANVSGATVFGNVEPFQLPFVDAAHISHDMRDQGAIRIMAYQPGVNVDAMEERPLDREPCHFPVGQVQFEWNAFKSLVAFHQLVETADFIFINGQEGLQALEGIFQVFDLFRYDLKGIDRNVFGHQQSVAVVDQSTCRGERGDLDPVVMGKHGVVFVPEYLKKHQPGDQACSQQDDECRSRSDPVDDQAVLVNGVFKTEGRHGQYCVGGRHFKALQAARTSGQAKVPVNEGSQ